MSSKFRIELPDKVAQSKALAFARARRDIRIPVAHMLSDAELLHFYGYVLSGRRVCYTVSEIEYGFDNDLYVIDIAAARISKAVLRVAKYIYGSILRLFRRIVYIFRHVKGVESGGR